MAISRSTWTTRQPNWTTDGPKRSVYIHHTVTPARPRSRAEERSHMRELEAMHLNRGFTGIGYNFVLFPSGRLYEGRPVWAVPAAQLNANSGTVAIAFVGDYTRDQTTRAQRLRVRVALASLRIRRGVRALGGHQEAPGQATSCPGGNILKYLDRWARKTGLRRV